MKILLLTDVQPCKHFGGSLLTDTLCQFMPKDEIVCYVSHTRSLATFEVSPDLDWMPITFSVKPRENTIHLPGARWKLFSFWQDLYSRWVRIPKLARKIIAFGKEHQVDRLWCILQGQTMIRLARPVAKGLGIPLLTQIWDYPQWWIRENKLDRFTGRSIMKEYEKVMRASTCCAAASQAMADELHEAYGTNSVPIIGCLDPSMAIKPTTPIPEPNGEYVIGMAGQLYASREWYTLLETLRQVDWKLNGRNVRLRYLGYHIAFDTAHSKACVEHLGYRSQTETVEILSKCDALYCPFFSEPELEYIARSSFPSKLATYLAAGRPVFFHGPDYAPPSKFINQNQAGVTCSSLDPEVVASALEEFLADRPKYNQFVENAHKAFCDHLTTDSLRENFLRFRQTT